MTVDLKFHPELLEQPCFIAPNATVVGHVQMGAQTGIWYGAVVRGDCEQIRIGRQTNVQDLCVIHADSGYPCVIGQRVTIGHAAIVHGAQVDDDVMIGMRAVVMNGAKIGAGSIIGVGAVITEGKQIPPNSLVLGMPGKIVRACTDTDVERVQHACRHYVDAMMRAYELLPMADLDL